MGGGNQRARRGGFCSPLWNHRGPETALVIDPLDNFPEHEVRSDELPPMLITPSLRFSLFALRRYLILMTILLLHDVLDLAGFLHHRL
jgi:hypothetical protein